MFGERFKCMGGGLEEESRAERQRKREGSKINVNKPRVPKGAGSKIL
jgi:hypothetical protein